MGTLCVNRTKAQVRTVVASTFDVWYNDIANQTFFLKDGTPELHSDNSTVYTLPATVWEIEQFIAERTYATRRWNRGKGRVALHCFENDWAVYASQKDTRMFMGQEGEHPLYPNLDFHYHHLGIYPNEDCTRNFFGWFDFCGNPTQERLDIVTHPKNFVHNSVVFATFPCAWRLRDTVQPDILDTALDLAGDDDELCNHATDAVEAYMEKHTGNKVKCIVSMEYQAQRTPMMLLGFTNSREIISTIPFECRHRKERTTPSKPSRPSVKLTAEKKSSLQQDLRVRSYRCSTELAEKYQISVYDVGTTLSWMKRRGEKNVGYR